MASRKQRGAWYWALLGLGFGPWAGPAIAADPLKPVAYYFPRKEACTVMMDYQKAGDRLRGLGAEARALELARSMLSEWSVNGAAKCNGASKVTMLAVYIPGMDIYGRPDFGNRTNVMQLKGEAAKLRALDRAGEKITMAQLRSSSLVEVF